MSLNELINKHKKSESIEQLSDFIFNSYDSLPSSEKNKVIDYFLKLVELDQVPENQLTILFELLDKLKRYDDAISLIIKYPQIISNHFEQTYNVFNYNVEHEWNWDLKKLKSMKEQEWRDDLKTTILDNEFVSKYKLAKLITSRLNNEKIKKNSVIQLQRENMWKMGGYPSCQKNIEEIRKCKYSDEAERYLKECNEKEPEDSDLAWYNFTQKYSEVSDGLGDNDVCLCKKNCCQNN
ncbi:MAG: hypothetical protein Hyperionvirus10_28 [Hyperionvirus sp.]|uniref:DED domain-containing protein n=1 Tax=Hyperionvirus sp. TaxID=2487770 RepID=A0A3G5A9D1_9VIRU|nr:MAG: hypothetical protein Hyperionvirus10_28 [Hyperionvirus sp.]